MELFVLLHRDSIGQEKQTDQQNIRVLHFKRTYSLTKWGFEKERGPKKKEIVKLTRTRTKDNNSVNNEKKMAQNEKISSITEFDEEQEREKEV